MRSLLEAEARRKGSLSQDLSLRRETRGLARRPGMVYTGRVRSWTDPPAGLTHEGEAAWVGGTR